MMRMTGQYVRMHLRQKEQERHRSISRQMLLCCYTLWEMNLMKKRLKENYAYYEKRTLHGSSLSPSIFSVMGA